jgi:Rieske Fe-S protein
MGDPDRRKFLTITTCGIGGAVGLAVAVPSLSLIVDPARKQTVTTPRDPLDVGDLRMLGPEWRKVEVIAPEVRDAWVTEHNVVLGGAWLRQKPNGPVEALSATCPHLGCPVTWQGSSFFCPCHNSEFGPNGELRGNGPAKRPLDPLPIEVKDGRLRLTWVTYKLDTKDREQA